MTFPQTGGADAPGGSSAPPSHRRGRGGRSWAQRLIITSGVLLAVIALIGAALVGVLWFKLNRFERVSADLDAKPPDGPVNFLMVGSDSRAGISSDDPDADAFLGDEVSGQRTDTIMVVRVDAAANSISILSVPRDLWVPITGVGEDRINTAFAVGGAQLLIDTVRSVLQVDINHYVEIDFRGFRELVQTIGGVPMYFDTPLQDENSGLFIPVAGCVTLDGDQALAFARARHLQYLNAAGDWEDDPTADLGRITRQQLFLRKAMDKASTLGLGDLTRINRLVDVGTDNVKFDDDLKTSELVGLIRRFSETRGDGMATYSLPAQPFETAEGASVLALDTVAAQPILDIFRGVVPAAGPTTTVLSPAQVAVTVLNGTGVSGQAREVADALGQAGFVVAKVGDASVVGEAQTSLRYSPGYRPQADLVAALLQPGVAFLEDVSAGNGVVLTTGADFRGITLPEAPATTLPGDEVTTTTAVGIAPPDQAPPGEACG